jgi:hypothetical protein
MWFGIKESLGTMIIFYRKFRATLFLPTRSNQYESSVEEYDVIALQNPFDALI